MKDKMTAAEAAQVAAVARLTADIAARVLASIRVATTASLWHAEAELSKTAARSITATWAATISHHEAVTEEAENEKDIP